MEQFSCQALGWEMRDDKFAECAVESRLAVIIVKADISRTCTVHCRHSIKYLTCIFIWHSKQLFVIVIL